MAVSACTSAGLLGNPTTGGSLCQLRNYINCNLVDHAGKVFNVADQFITNSFKAHLIATVCTHLGVSAPTDEVSNTCSQEWLERTAKGIVERAIMPVQPD